MHAISNYRDNSPTNKHSHNPQTGPITIHGLPITDYHKFDTELVSSIINDLKVGKALDIDGLSAEHLQFCHPVLCLLY